MVEDLTYRKSRSKPQGIAATALPESALLADSARLLVLSFGMTDRSRFSIIPIGSLHTGWALKVDGIIRRSSPSLISLGAYVDAIMAGADEADADNIARAIEARPWPTYEERMAVFSPAGPWKPSRAPFKKQSVGARHP
jgi:hypothetical protein